MFSFRERRWNKRTLCSYTVWTIGIVTIEKGYYTYKLRDAWKEVYRGRARAAVESQ